jgi:tyrosinase
MPKAVPLVNLREPIPQGYFPKLNSALASRSWPGRPDNAKLQDLNRRHDAIKVSIDDVEEWRNRFLQAIDQGYVTDVSGNRVELDEKNGIDILGNMMEASETSINFELYGDLHNAGHLFISFAHDPDGRYLEPQGIMGNSAVAMRYVFSCIFD